MSEDDGVQVCPKCGYNCNNDVTIDDHGMCRDCLLDWQFGEDEEDEE